MKHLPVGLIKGETLAEVWENAVVFVYQNGIDIPTHYDKPNSLPSKEATVTMYIKNALSEPMITKNFPGSIGDLEIYDWEINKSAHDHWITKEDDTRWSYSYSDRLFNYDGYINQMKTNVIPQLKSNWHSKRAQMITWSPSIDPTINHSPCMQRIWYRLTKHEDKLYLHMNIHFRSRDLFRAAFMNSYAFIQMQKNTANILSEELNKKVYVGSYLDSSDSLHIYSECFKDVEKEIEKYKLSSYKTRSWDSTSPMIQQLLLETRQKLEKDVDYMLSK